MKNKLIVLVIIAAVLGLAWYFAASRSGSPLSLGGSLNPNCEYEDPDLCKFLNNVSAYQNFSMRTNTGGQETLMEISGDSSRSVYTEGGREMMHVINIGKTTYSKDYSDNAWWKYTYKDEQEAAENPFSASDFDFGEMMGSTAQTTYQAAGKEACGSLTCFKYQVITPGASGEEYIWFDDRQYRLRMSQSIHGGQTTDAVYSYDRISVRAPSPTKEASSIMQLYGGGMMGDFDPGSFDFSDFNWDF